MNYYANPYDLCATGFYFDTYEEYLEKSEKHVNNYGEPVEEYEIQFIDGDYHELFMALGIEQSNLDVWFEHFEDMSEEDMAKCFYLANDRGHDIDGVLENYELVQITQQSAEDYAYDWFNGCYGVPGSVACYIDYDAFQRDLELGGDICTITVCGEDWLITNANSNEF